MTSFDMEGIATMLKKLVKDEFTAFKADVTAEFATIKAEQVKRHAETLAALAAVSTRVDALQVNVDTVVFYDHRIQTRDVHIFRLVTESTIEENILLKARQKRQLQHMSLEEGNVGASAARGTRRPRRA